MFLLWVFFASLLRCLFFLWLKILQVSAGDYNWNTDDELEVFGMPSSGPNPTSSSQESCEQSVVVNLASIIFAKISAL